MATPKNKSNTPGTTGDKILDEALKKLGINPDDVRKDSTFDAKLIKMAVLGVLESIKTFSEGSKTVLLNTPGPMNSGILRVYLMAILSSADFALQALDEYDVQIYGKAMPADPLAGLGVSPLDRRRAASSKAPLASVHIEDDKRGHDGIALDPFSEMDEKELEDLTQEDLEALGQALDAPVDEPATKPAGESKPESDDILDRLLKGFTPHNRGGKGSN